MSNETQPQRSLVRKLAEVMGEVDRVPKSGRNNFHNYDYATEADIVAAVRSGLSARNVMMLPNVISTEWKEIQRAKGGIERLCTLKVRFTFHDGDSGETLDVEALGEGQDPGDKATYKAFTGATKYALLKTFLIPTGDDPEAEDDPAPSQRASRSKPQMPQRSATQAPATKSAPLPNASREPGSDDGEPDALERESASIIKAAEAAKTQADLSTLKPRAMALPRESPEYKAAARALTEAFGRISAKVPA